MKNLRQFVKWNIINNYSPQCEWLAEDIYRAAKRFRGEIIIHRRSDTPQKKNWMISSLATDANQDAIFFPSCSEVNSKRIFGV